MDSLKDLFPRMESEESTEESETEFRWWIDIYVGGHGFNFQYKTKEAVVNICDLLKQGSHKFITLMDNDENYVVFRTSEISAVNARRQQHRGRRD